jgi:pimeloyl-ACP methyl ester carboxylesterase
MAKGTSGAAAGRRVRGSCSVGTPDSVHIFYLHGFASSPESTKAQFFSERFAARGLTLHCPDFNQPDFSTLTVSRMLQEIETGIAALPPGDVILMGSSLGGFVAVEAAARSVNRERHPIAQLILLAPAVELDWERWPEIGPRGIDRWRKSGSIEVFHYAHNRPQALGFSFYEDATRYSPASKRLEIPMLIFQGRRDESVRPATVERFAHAQPHAELHLLDDDHQLKGSLNVIWGAIESRILTP